MLAAVALVLLALALLLPVVAWAVRRRRRDVGTLLVLGVPAALVGVAAVAFGTESSPAWGAALVGAAPAVTALTAGWAVMITGAWRGVGRLACAGLVAAVLALLVVTPYRDPHPWRLGARITSGAYAGVLTVPATKNQILRVQDAAARWLRPGEGVLFYGLPGGYLLTNARVDSNLEWLSTYHRANQAVLDWFGRTGRRPDVVIVDWAIVRLPGGLATLARTDPLMAYVLREYRTVEAGANRPTVLVRKDRGGAPPG
jgi:hypothetical protein